LKELHDGGHCLLKADDVADVVVVHVWNGGTASPRQAIDPAVWWHDEACAGDGGNCLANSRPELGRGLVIAGWVVLSQARERVLHAPEQGPSLGCLGHCLVFVQGTTEHLRA